MPTTRIEAIDVEPGMELTKLGTVRAVSLSQHGARLITDAGDELFPLHTTFAIALRARRAR